MRSIGQRWKLAGWHQYPWGSGHAVDMHAADTEVVTSVVAISMLGGRQRPESGGGDCTFGV